MSEELISKLIQMLTDLSSSFPILVSIMAILYAAGMIFKAGREFVKKVVEATQTKKDDAALEKVEGSKVFKIVAFVFDLFIRIKIK